MHRSGHRIGCAALLLAGCTVGAPPGFSGGDQWTFPLVGPLEGGLLITPVSVHGKGPYLFAFDPDANVSAVDKELVEEAGLRMGNGPHRIDETDTGQTRLYAEMLDLKVSGLVIDRRDVMVFPGGLYDTENRHLRGILGRDVTADSLVFGFDRDQGIATLSTTKAFHAPPEAIAIKYQAVSSRSSDASGRKAEARYDPNPNRPAQEDTLPVGAVGDVTPVPRRLANAKVGPSTFAMHLDLGAAVSQLPEKSWARAGLVQADGRMRLVDEAATVREATVAGLAHEVTLGAAKAPNVTFVPYIEKRFATEGVEGALGLDFFRPYAVYAHWDASTYFLKARGDAAATTAARLGRWGSALPACPHPGCATATAVAADAAAGLTVTRDAEAGQTPLEVFLGATSSSGTVLAPLIVVLPPGAPVRMPVAAEYAGATLVVLDASPFPRECGSPAGCMMQLGGPLLMSAPGAAPAATAPAATAPAPVAPAPAAPASTGAPRNVPPDKLRRLTGDAAIPPSDDARKAGKLAVAIVRVCLHPDGKVDSTKIVKPSGVPAYDEQLQRTIAATWTFEPTEVDGQRVAVCTSVTFTPPR